MPPRPEPDQEPPVDAPTWTPDVREPDPDLLPDELPVPKAKRGLAGTRSPFDEMRPKLRVSPS